MARLDRYLQHAVKVRASDIHFSSDEPVRLRVDGDLVAMEESPLDADTILDIFTEIFDEAELEKFHKQKNLDKSYSVEGAGNFRVNVFMTRLGFSAVVRTIPSKIPTLKDLGLPDAVQTLSELPKGLVLVTGPTGSGKSTTLAAMIDHINSYYPYHILTVEDPVEFVHQSRASLINQREIGGSCHSFSDALKYALREDPDVILVGELRDLETISLALTAAETGHLVLGTLHTRGAAASIDRIIDSFPANQQAMVRTMLAESLMGVISQTLLKRKDGKGRVAAYEIMMVNHAISNLVREGKTFQIPSVIQTARREGMILMGQHIRELLQQGLITDDEAAQFLDEGQSKAKPAARPTARPTPAAAKPAAAAPAAMAPKPGPAAVQPRPAPVAPAPVQPKPAAPRPAPRPAPPSSFAAAAAAALKSTAAATSRNAGLTSKTAAPPAPPARPAGGPPKGPPPMKAPPAGPRPGGFAPMRPGADGGAAKSRPVPPPKPTEAAAPLVEEEPPAPPEENVESLVTDLTDPSQYSDDGEIVSVDLSTEDLTNGEGIELSSFKEEHEQGSLREVAESTGTHELQEQRTSVPPKKTG